MSEIHLSTPPARCEATYKYTARNVRACEPGNNKPNPQPVFGDARAPKAQPTRTLPTRNMGGGVRDTRLRISPLHRAMS